MVCINRTHHLHVHTSRLQGLLQGRACKWHLHPAVTAAVWHTCYNQGWLCQTAIVLLHRLLGVVHNTGWPLRKNTAQAVAGSVVIVGANPDMSTTRDSLPGVAFCSSDIRAAAAAQQGRRNPSAQAASAAAEPAICTSRASAKSLKSRPRGGMRVLFKVRRARCTWAWACARYAYAWPQPWCS